MHQHKISVLIFERSVDLGGAFSKPTVQDRGTSFGIEAWQSKQLSFALISDTDPAENLAQLLKQVNE
jgi:hypothetical protein